ncbi:MAG TPA: universal stress protein [Solirubrobacterales bacterium]|jgi:nucleotide-binding universal stress UspA family protein|nr:universal stress protein [Solirubrobacterales bacterium]
MAPSSEDTRPVLIAFDGSDFAKAAIVDAGRQLRPGREAIVLTVREPMESIPFLGVGGTGIDQRTIDTIVAETESGAEGVAAEGARLASEAGLEARPLVETGAPVWRCLVEVAEKHDAGLIVLGSRGRSGLSYVLLGSVATAVAQHSKRSVMIVHTS